MHTHVHPLMCMACASHVRTQVMLSMLVLAFEDIAAGAGGGTTRFPTCRLELYATAVRAPEPPHTMRTPTPQRASSAHR